MTRPAGGWGVRRAAVLRPRGAAAACAERVWNAFRALAALLHLWSPLGFPGTRQKMLALTVAALGLRASPVPPRASLPRATVSAPTPIFSNAQLNTELKMQLLTLAASLV